MLEPPDAPRSREAANVGPRRPDKGGDDIASRRREAVIAGFREDEPTARRHREDENAAVRASSLRSLARLGRLKTSELADALTDRAAAVRVTALELAANRADIALSDLVTALGDPDAAVVESAAWACGEKAGAASEPAARDPVSVADATTARPRTRAAREAVTTAVAALANVATRHSDALCRESAIAALGSIGDRRGLQAILGGLQGRPEVRRRAVIALSPFSGPEVEAALELAKTDRDKQVRAAAEELSLACAPEYLTS